MKRPFIFLVTALLLLGLGTTLLTAQTPRPRSLAQTLRASRWQKRILLVAAPTATQADFQRQKALLAANQAQLADRDMLVLDVLYDQLPAADRQFLAQKIGLPPAGFVVVLIGKDGGVKAKSTHPMAPATLFATVDGMPMRRAEMQRTHAGHQP